ncbi:MAG: hypothetical protein CFE23_16340 [Flavobacterium sp. BFFFF1]|uniref:DUF3800 domain-containing protein n=1 Tax=Flavobacterium sp. BFFFF1 TaxID=2015557 RepID=UPI000BC96164|nr:DUF3800 domain-containing protein [Flavobacterium sp. BFFFF1]OYU78939.1 MAG: hypothetical protein CFE23_16340 [Flavobacterium sp. BFFFF1]
MYIMYVDESGDPGSHKNSSPHFILSAIIVSENEWDKYLVKLKTFRKALRDTYGLNQRSEIHCKELVRPNNNLEYKKISKTNRMNLLKDYATQLPNVFDTAQILNICLKKSELEGIDFFELAWSRLLQRYDTFLKKEVKDKGIIISDDTSNLKLMNLHRKMRIYNPIPSHYSIEPYNAPIDSILEDIFSRDSKHSYFIQSTDVIAYLLYKKEFPQGSIKKYGIEKQFDKLEPILLKKASKNDKFGIVRK